MKTLKIIPALFAILLTSFSFAEETAELLVKPLQEVTSEALDFDKFPSESVVGALSEYVTEQESVLDMFSQRVKKKRTLLYPYSENLVFVNGVLCHVGNYPRSIIYTVLEGPQYGLQTVSDYYGELLYVNYDFDIEYTPYGMILHHDYDDSEVITGSTQVIKFY